MFRQADPGEGSSKPVQFRYHKGWLPGESWEAWLAGPIQWIECHTHPDAHSKPCLAWITHNALKCPRCGPKFHREKLGFVPVYRCVNLQDKLIILREPQREMTDLLEFGDLVICSKEDAKDAPITVQKANRQRKLSSTLPRRQVPADLEYSLLTLWKINELWEWARQRGHQGPPKKLDALEVADLEPGTYSLNLEQLGQAVDADTERAEKRAAERTRIGKWIDEKKAEDKTRRNGKPHAS
jgi:hypothetical protein